MGRIPTHTDAQLIAIARDCTLETGPVDISRLAAALEMTRLAVVRRIRSLRADHNWPFPARPAGKPKGLPKPLKTEAAPLPKPVATPKQFTPRPPKPTVPCDLCGKPESGKLYSGEPFELEGLICLGCLGELIREAEEKEKAERKLERAKAFVPKPESTIEKVDPAEYEYSLLRLMAYKLIHAETISASRAVKDEAIEAAIPKVKQLFQPDDADDKYQGVCMNPRFSPAPEEPEPVELMADWFKEWKVARARTRGLDAAVLQVKNEAVYRRGQVPSVALTEQRARFQRNF